MGRQGPIGERLRQRLYDERIRHDWSQTVVAASLQRQGLAFYASTVSKIEAGSRDVTVDELNAFADLFGVSSDELIGRNLDGSDLVWAMSKLTSTAQRIGSEIAALRARMTAELKDVQFYQGYAQRGHNSDVIDLISIAGGAEQAMSNAQQAMMRLANRFPMPS